MRNAFVHRQFQHLRIDHDHPNMFRRRLVDQTQDHRVDADRLAGTGGSRNEQVRHARKIRNDGHAADVLAEREGQRGANLIVGLGLDDFPERDDFALLVGDLQPHHRLAGNDFHDAHADRRQCACKILGKTADLTDLHAGRRTQFKPRDHRPRLDGHHLDLDAKIPQLDFHQPRHRLQCLVRIGLLTRARLIEQGQRRQFAGFRRIEQWYLALAFDPIALLRQGGRRLDARRRSVGDFLLLFAYHFLARLLAKLAGCELAPLLQAASGPLDRFQNRSAELVHHFEPRDAQKQRHPRQPQPQQQQRGTEKTQTPGEIRSREISEYAAGAARQSRTAPVQRGQAAAGPQCQREPQRAQQGIDPRAGIRQHRFLMDEPTCVGQHHGKQIRRSAKEK